jgi:hypothetical protein
VGSLRRFLTGLYVKRGAEQATPRTFCNHIAAAIARIEALLGWLLTTSFDFETASTGIQETESLRTKAANRKKATYASSLTKGIYVLYGVFETKTPQKHFIQRMTRCQSQVWIRACLPKGSNGWGLSLDQCKRCSPLRQQHVRYRDIVRLFVVDLVGGTS